MILKFYLSYTSGGKSILVGFDIQNMREYFNLKEISLTPTLDKTGHAFSITYWPIMVHPRKTGFNIVTINDNEVDINKLTKIVGKINEIVQQRNLIVKEEKKKDKEAIKHNTEYTLKSKASNNKKVHNKELEEKIYNELQSTIMWDDLSDTDEYDSFEGEEKAEDIVDGLAKRLSRFFSDAFIENNVTSEKIQDILNDTYIEINNHTNPKWWINMDMYNDKEILTKLLRGKGYNKEINQIFKDY